jgi:hypothetical protein
MQVEDAIDERRRTFSAASNEMLAVYLEAYKKEIETIRAEMVVAEKCLAMVMEEQARRRKTKRWL